MPKASDKIQYQFHKNSQQTRNRRKLSQPNGLDIWEKYAANIIRNSERLNLLPQDVK